MRDIETLHAGQVVRLTRERIRLPSGAETELEIIRHVGGSAVVALDTAEQICLIRQYLHAAGGWIWEIPAGKLDSPTEDAAQAARRELAEETGVLARQWRHLGTILTTPGFCDERIHLYLAQDLEHVPATPQAHECIEVHWIPLATALHWIPDGRISDAKTIIALYLTENALKP